MSIINKIDKIQPNGYFPKPTKEAALNTDFIVKYNLFPIAPLINGDKSPNYDWTDPNNQIKNVEELQKLNGWWPMVSKNGKPYKALITGACLVCGEASNIIVIDLDRHGNKKTLESGEKVEIDGIEEFNKMITKNNIPSSDITTFTTKTPSDGIHKYFTYNSIINQSGANGDIAVDHRSDGGLAVLPGTKRRDTIEWQYEGKIYNNPNELVTVQKGTGETQVKVSEKGVGKPITKIWREYTVKDDIQIIPLSDDLATTIKEAYDNSKKSASKTTSVASSSSDIENKKTKAKAKMVEPNKIIDAYYQEVGEGGRSVHLCGYLGHLCRQVTDTKELYILASLFNQKYIKPSMSDDDIKDLVVGAEQRRDEKDFYINWKNKKINTGNLVKYVTMHNHLYAVGNKLFCYNEKLGVYERKETHEIEKIFYGKVQNFSDIDADKSKKFLKSILGYTQINPDIEGDERRFIICDNGVIDTETDELLPHSPNYKISCKFNGSYNPNYKEWKEAFDKSRFKKFLLELFSGDEEIITVIGEIFGNVLSPHQRELEKIAIFYGGGSNGKSSIFDIIEALFHDKDDICSIKFVKFSSSDRFTLAQAVGKRLNLVRDDKLPEEVGSNFNSFVTGERISIEDKNLPVKLVRFNCASLYGVNKLPNTKNKTNGWYRRNTIIPFKVRFGTQSDIDEGKADKLIDSALVPSIIKEEMDIIFNFAYYGYKRFKKNGFKFSRSTAISNTLEEYRADTDSVYSFMKNRCVKSPGTKIKAKEFYNEYLKYCDEEGIPPRGKREVFAALQNNYGIEKKPYQGYDYFRDISVGELKEVIDYEKEYKKLLKENKALAHNNEVSKKLIEKLRANVRVLQDNDKCDLELVSRIEELEKEKANLLKERNKYINMYNEEIKESNEYREIINLLKEKEIIDLLKEKGYLKP